ncbi:DUF7553 family protein [Halobaculum lipolyticum]|uniref:Uncharacterized protein n=1 Tax=Halobaculum lipolyticum TaxID=3032001 RepID=A0ABD5WFC1_9EURY|nr:hypothetical protein [Halobaculum sp. DT31]
MTRDLLADASEHLRRAADAAGDDAAARFERVADDLRTAADAEHGPDHGWMAKRIHTIRDAASDAGDEVTGHAEAAVECISEYRADVPGV